MGGFGVVRPAVRPDFLTNPIFLINAVRPSQFCWGYISKTIKDLNLKLQGCIGR